MNDGDGLHVGGYVVPESELEWSFDPSGGPGGQHANRSSTRVTLDLNLERTEAFPPEVRANLQSRLGRKARRGRLRVTVDDTRSQWRNRTVARERMTALLERALAPRKIRRATTPSPSARRRRLEKKRRRGLTKRLRRRPELDE